MLNDYEAAVAHLIAGCPVAAKMGKKRKNDHSTGLGGNLKAGTAPKTGVDLRCYKPKELSQLSQEVMGELKELRPPHKGNGKRTHTGGGTHFKGNDNKSWFRKIKDQVAATLKQQLLDNTRPSNRTRWIFSEIAKIFTAAQPSNHHNDTAAAAAVKLNASLKRKRDQRGSTPKWSLSWAVGRMETLEPNTHLCDLIVMLVLNEVGNCKLNGIFALFTKLDAHANMAVIGKQAFVFSHSGQYDNMQVLAEEVKGLPTAPIVDAVIAYDHPFSGETYILVVRNALCVPTMEINLMPFVILREAGFILNDTQQMHCDEPSVEGLSLFDEESGLKISFTLNEMLSVVASQPLDEQEVASAENYQTVFLTPDSNSWDPYDT